MKAPEEPIHIEDTDWTFVKTRALDRGNIYIADDGSRYLRVGPIDRIHDESDFAKNVQELSFPTPEVLGEGDVDAHTAYFIETSLGSLTFGDIFRTEYSDNGVVSNESFRQYGHIASLFLEAQLNSANTVTGPSGLRDGIALDNVIDENPELEQRLEEAFDTASTNTEDLPLVLSHGDLGPFNMMPGGVIDFEHGFIAPVGLDVLASPFLGRFWNFSIPGGANKSAYDFTEDQVQQYLSVIDAVSGRLGLDGLSKHVDDMMILKAVRMASFEKQRAEKIGHTHIWDGKKAILSYCLDQYLTDRPIESSTFGRH